MLLQPLDKDPRHAGSRSHGYMTPSFVTFIPYDTMCPRLLNMAACTVDIRVVFIRAAVSWFAE
jgi:hypothetical protein